MKITKVKFYDVCNVEDSKFLAKCTVLLDNCLALNDIKVLNGNKGNYIIMPSKGVCGESSVLENFRGEDLFHPVSRHFFSYMSDTILSGYHNLKCTGDKVYYPE